MKNRRIFFNILWDHDDTEYEVVCSVTASLAPTIDDPGDPGEIAFEDVLLAGKSCPELLEKIQKEDKLATEVLHLAEDEVYDARVNDEAAYGDYLYDQWKDDQLFRGDR